MNRKPTPHAAPDPGSQTPDARPPTPEPDPDPVPAPPVPAPAYTLRVYDAALAFVRALRVPVRRVVRADAALADQLRRAAASVPLNIAEGSRRAGRDKAHHYRVAAGSASEARAALEVAEAWGYLSTEDIGEAIDAVDSVQAMLWRLIHPGAPHRRGPLSGEAAPSRTPREDSK